MNSTRLYNKHSAIGEMLINEQGFSEFIRSSIESIDDHIKNNLNRESDKPDIEFFRIKQSKLKELL